MNSAEFFVHVGAGIVKRVCQNGDNSHEKKLLRLPACGFKVTAMNPQKEWMGRRRESWKTSAFDIIGNFRSCRTGPGDG